MVQGKDEHAIKESGRERREKEERTKVGGRERTKVGGRESVCVHACVRVCVTSCVCICKDVEVPFPLPTPPLITCNGGELAVDDSLCIVRCALLLGFTHTRHDFETSGEAFGNLFTDKLGSRKTGNRARST